MNASKGRKVIIMSGKEETELITLRRELALLKKQLEEAELRAIAWESMVDAIEQDLGLEVKKKPWNQASEEAKARLYPGECGSASKDSAGSTASASKPGTSGKHPLKRK
jgi:hypothetical protein